MLLLVLVLIVVAVSTAYAMSKTSLVEVLSTRQHSQHSRAQLLARSGIALAERALQDDLIEGDPITKAVESDRDAWAVLAAPGDRAARRSAAADRDPRRRQQARPQRARSTPRASGSASRARTS